MTVDQGADQGRRGLLRVQPQVLQPGVVLRRQSLPVQQASRQAGDGDVVGLLGEEGRVVVPAVWVKQAQAAEVARAAQLLWGRGQQQHPGGPLRQGRHQVIFRAGGGLRPAQVMGLVDDQQVPVRGQQGLPGGGVGQQALQRTEGQGLDQEGVVGAVSGRPPGRGACGSWPTGSRPTEGTRRGIRLSQIFLGVAVGAGSAVLQQPLGDGWLFRVAVGAGSGVPDVR